MRAPDPAPPGSAGRGLPLALLVASAVLAAEAVALLALAGWLLYASAAGTPDNEAVARGSTAYFVVLGLLIGVVALALARRQGWAGGAAIFVQLLALPMAWYMLSEGFLLGGVPLGLAAATALGCLLAPRTRDVLGR